MDSTSNLDQPQRQMRLLVCNIGRIGDTIIRNSLLKPASKIYDQIDYLCGRGNREIVAADTRLHRVHLHANSLSGLMGTAKLLLLGKHDCLLDLKDHDSSTSLLLASLSRAKIKIGCNRPRRKPFNRDSTSVYALGKRKLEVIQDLAKIAGIDGENLKLTVHCTADSEAWFASHHASAGKFYFVNVSATDPTRMWTAAAWGQLLKRFDENGKPIFVSGIPEHGDQVDAIVGQLRNGVAFKPRCLMDVVAAVGQTEMMLSVDTGLIQVAAAFGKPLLGLYSSSIVRSEFAPTGRDQLTVVTENNQPLAHLKPEIVIHTLKEAGVLNRS